LSVAFLKWATGLLTFVNTCVPDTSLHDFRWLTEYRQSKWEVTVVSYNAQYNLSPYLDKSNTTGAIIWVGTAYPSEAHEFPSRFSWDSCCSIFSFICMFCWSLFVLLYFFFWPLCCLSVFDIRILFAPLVSSNSS
jgi:hypothetical protein